VEALLGALQDDDSRVRAAACVGLADVRTRETVDPLQKAARDDHAEVRQAALMALGEIGHPSASAIVKTALQDDAPSVRFQAVIAYPRVCTDREEAIAALLDATHDEDHLVCHVALRMAEEMGDAREVVDPRIAERAIVLLKHASSRIRVTSAVILGRSGRADGQEILLAVAGGERQTDDLEDEAAAIELCGDLGLREAIVGLALRAWQARLFHRDPLAWQARVALAQLADPRATAWIEGELGAWNRQRRTLAVAAAGRAKLLTVRPIIEAMRGRPARADQHAVEQALAQMKTVEGDGP
jgi:HEAT repeat protein